MKSTKRMFNSILAFLILFNISSYIFGRLDFSSVLSIGVMQILLGAYVNVNLNRMDDGDK